MISNSNTEATLGTRGFPSPLSRNVAIMLKISSALRTVPVVAVVVVAGAVVAGAVSYLGAAVAAGLVSGAI